MALDPTKKLQFRMGSKQGLDAITTYAPGTVYVTTDEQAMYVDVASDKRIRISDIIQINSVKDLGEPPYSTDGFYYFIQDNALMKCLGEDGKGGWNWVQLNSVSDVTANLNQVEGRVSTLETSVGTLNTTVTRLNGEANVPGSVAEAKAAADAAQEDATEALNKIGVPTAEGQTASGLYAKVETAQSTANKNATDISNLDSRVEDTETAIATLASTDNTKDGSVAKAQKTADDAVAAARAADTKAGNAATAAANAQTTANEAKQSAATNAGEIATVKGTVSSLEGSLDTVSDKVTSLEGRMKTAETDIDALQAYEIVLKGEGEGSIKDAKKAGTEAQATANKNKEDLATLTGTVNDLSSSIDDINDELDALEPRVKANEDKIKDLQGDLGASNAEAGTGTAFARIAALEKSLGDGTGSTSVTSRLTAVETKADNNAQAISGLQTSVRDNSGAISDINNALGQKGVASDSTAFGLIAKNETAIGTNATAIQALQDTVGNSTKGLVQQVNTNKTDIATLKGTVDAIPSTYVNKTDYAKDKEDLAAEMEEQHELIIQSINAANGMTYKKAVTTYNELPTASTEEAPVRVGDTYVVAAEDGFIENGVVYYSGDLLVAKGNEVDGVITGTITWDHVKTGYVYKHEATMGAKAGTDNDVAVKLTSFQAVGSNNEGDLGKFTIKGGENVTVSIEGSVITIGMAWDTF